MAHKTRKKLTKKEIQRDPIHDKLEQGLFFIQTHQKEVLGGLLGLIIIILVAQYLVARRTASDESAMAGFITASQIYSQSASAASMNQLQQAMQGMDAAYSMAMQTWNENPQNEWARKAAILAAKIDIIRGNYEGALSTLSTVLAADPDDETKIPALVHMGILLENRGSEQDLNNAVSTYNEILALADEDREVRAEALFGLSRASYALGQADASLEYLEQAMAMGTDTTEFENYRLAQLVEMTR